MTDDSPITFVNKPVNNVPYEWGRNCATLRFDKEQTERCLGAFGYCGPQADIDQFWEGFNDGPREDGTVISLPSPERLLVRPSNSNPR